MNMIGLSADLNYLATDLFCCFGKRCYDFPQNITGHDFSSVFCCENKMNTKENYYWLPHREVGKMIFDYFDGNGAYTQGFIESRADGSYTFTVDSDPPYEEFAAEPFTGSSREVMVEAKEFCLDLERDTFFNVFYQAGDYEVVKSMVGDLVGGVDDEELMEIPLGKQFFERNTFYCPDPSKLDAECKKAMKKREKTKVESLSLYDFEDEIYDLRSQDEDS